MISAQTYRFKTDWRIPSDPDTVWQAVVNNPTSWPEWWPALRAVSQTTPRVDTAGSSFDSTWQSRGYRLHCSIHVAAAEVATRATLHFSGDLSGKAICRMQEVNGETYISIDWELKTNKRWMNLIAPVLSPIFALNHHSIMRSGELGLREFVSGHIKNPDVVSGSFML